MSEIGIELKVARIRRGLKQADLKEALGIPQCVVSRIENGGSEDYPEETAAMKEMLLEEQH